MVKTSIKPLILGLIMIQFYIFKNFEKYTLNYKYYISIKNKTMSKTKLSPIVAGTMNWGVWDKTSIPKKWKT
jgi:hypothetical protein